MYKYSLSDLKQSYKIQNAEENRQTKYSLLSFMVEVMKRSPFREDVRNTWVQ